MRLLFPLDGSDETYAAVEGALRLLGSGKETSATMLVVIAKGIREMPKEAREHLEFDDEDELFVRDDEAQAVVKRATEIANKAKVLKVQARIVSGKVKDVIVAESAKHDVLVMHQLDADEREEKRRGSATEELARNARCSVLLVKTG